jgi:hypothetical protein
MIVVQVRPDLSFEVIDREQEMVRLGAGGLDGKKLTAEATQAALQVMSKFRRLAESHSVEEIVAVATSAVREAENGGEFLQAIMQQTGIRAQVISGTEEARLIHLAANYGTGAPGEITVAIDIGGGSVEVTRGLGPNIDLGRSFKLGVIRLTERFVKSDPISSRDERKLVKHIEATCGEYLDEIASAGFDRVLGTSGTILSLGAIVAAEEGESDTALRNRRVTAKQLRKVRKNLAGLNLERRLKVPGLDPVAGTWPSPDRSCSTRSSAAWAPPSSRSAIYRSAKASCSTTSRVIARRSRSRIGIPISASAASSSSASGATTGRNTRIRSRGWPMRCSIARAARTGSPIASASGCGMGRSFTTSACTSATSGTTSTRTI